MPEAASSQRPSSILLVAGGTGGHIWPAVTFGKWIRERYPEVEILYMSGSRPLELEIYEAAGIKPVVLEFSGSPLGISLRKKIVRCFEMWHAFRRTRVYLRQVQPDLCLLFGGYLSAPALVVSRMCSIPVAVHEQNAYAGRVTKIADKWKVPIATGWQECEPLAAGHFLPVGVPVRQFESIDRTQAWRTLQLPGEPPTGAIAVVMTGSLGSGKLTEIAGKLAGENDFANTTFLVIGSEAGEPRKASGNLLYLPKTWNVGPLYNLADLLLVRGGASTLAEAAAAGIPSIVIPWRGATGDHQWKNAVQFQRSNRAMLWDEGAEGLRDLAGKMNNLLFSPSPSTGEVGKRMYNANRKICERLWDFANLSGRRGSRWGQEPSLT